MSEKITRQPLNYISEELLDRLLVALHPITFSPTSDRYDIGYYNAQQDFRQVLEFRLNNGKLPEVKAAVVETKKAKWPW